MYEKLSQAQISNRRSCSMKQKKKHSTRMKWKINRKINLSLEFRVLSLWNVARICFSRQTDVFNQIFTRTCFSYFLSLIFFILKFQMALDGKAIKEEIPDKEPYETTTTSIKKSKGKNELSQLLINMDINCTTRELSTKCQQNIFILQF